VAGTVTKLQVQKRRRDRVNVYLDGRYAFSLPEMEAVKLRRGQVLSDADIAQLRHRDELSKAYNLALGYLSYRPRSQAEVQTHLQRKGYHEALVAEVLARLQDAGLVDDVEFAQYWVENRMQFRPKGPVALRYELRQMKRPIALHRGRPAAWHLKIVRCSSGGWWPTWAEGALRTRQPEEPASERGARSMPAMIRYS
jgi:hypothetical protein